MTTPFALSDLARMPTDDELRASALEWLEALTPCLYENWPRALKDRSFRTEVVPLTKDDIETLLPTFDGWCDPQALLPLQRKIDAAAAAFGRTGFFPRLNSRSPKDSFHADGPDGFCCRKSGQVLRLFSGSERMLDDLCRWRQLDGCNLLLREFQVIPKHEEWRCFIRDRKVIGVSQYDYREVFPELAGQGERIMDACCRFLEEKVIHALHVDTVVCDLWMKEDPVLIEINPYGLADPCLFTYEELETAEGECRVRESVDSSLPPRP